MPTLRVNDVAPRIQYVGDGAQTSFTVPFFFFDPADLEVRFDDGAPASDHSVTGAGDPAGGAVVFVDPPAAGVRITIWREMPLRRGVEFQEAGAFRAASINDELDRLTMLTQELDERVRRASSLPPTSAAQPYALPEPAAGKYLRWTADGLALESVAPLEASDVAVTAFAETLLDDPDAAAARATLGIPAVLQNGAHAYAEAAGAPDAIALALNPPLAGYAAGQRFWFKAAADNAGPVSLAVSGLPAKPLLWRGAPLVARDVQAGQIVEAVYDGAAFQMTSPPPGGWRLLKTLLADNSPVLDFAGLDASYDLYQLVLTNLVPVTNNVELWLRVFVGGVIQDAGANYGYHTGGGSVASASYNAVVSGSANRFRLTQATLGSGSGHGYSGTLYVSGAAAANQKRLWSHGIAIDSSGVAYSAGFGGQFAPASPIDGLRVQMSAGNVASGKAALYGLCK